MVTSTMGTSPIAAEAFDEHVAARAASRLSRFRFASALRRASLSPSVSLETWSPLRLVNFLGAIPIFFFQKEYILAYRLANNKYVSEWYISGWLEIYIRL